MTDTVRQTITEFIAEHGIKMTANRAPSNPNFTDPLNGMDHWKVVFTRPIVGLSRHGQVKLTTCFSMGYRHHGAKPEAKDVLDCLASNASSVDSADFEEWARDLGYDPDSRKAEKTYKACEHGASRLKTFLGEELYQKLLYETERE
jgi:hypothetical protein